MWAKTRNWASSVFVDSKLLAKCKKAEKSYVEILRKPVNRWTTLFSSDMPVTYGSKNDSSY